ncbi:MAG: hypothetical protein PUD24_06170 [Oscillospiraceae bacterium]|nr:hypothetical protein [Oscillospiraceae bacterium]
MKNVLHMLCGIICIAVFLTSCSDANIDGNSKNLLAGEQTTVINGYEFPIDAVDHDHTYITANDVTYLGIGDTINDYVCLSNEEIGDFERGVKGLTYTLNHVTVYNSLSDAGVSFDDCYDLYDEQSIPEINNNKFMVVDMTAYYSIEDGNESSINVSLDFDIKFWNDKGANYHDIRPSLLWFSMHPVETDEELDRNKQYFVYRIKPGEAADFKLGILVGESYVNEHDVYLAQSGPEQKIDGFTPYYFKLFSEKTEYMYGEDLSR